MTGTRTATAIAHPNIAFAKYWGKRVGDGNFPAVPSVSVTLRGLSTQTTVAFREGLTGDRMMLDGAVADDAVLARMTAMLDRVRAAASFALFAEVTSANDFPTASGLASSASGFAALALAASRAAGLDWPADKVSDLARRSSASAARSVFGGFVELDAGPVAPTADDSLAARVVARADHLDLAVLVCVTSEGKKSVASTAGMRATAERSPYYATWLAEAPQIAARLKAALVAKDFDALGELTEASTFAMHASAMAAGVLYLRGATIDALAAVRELRGQGVAAYATMDAGPHVKVLVKTGDVPRATAHLAAVQGVLRVLDARPGDGAHIVDGANATAAASAT